MIWHRRAALNTPWNPWGDELFRIDGDHVVLADATHISEAVLRSRFDVAARTPKQTVLAEMPTPTASNPSFRGHGTISGGVNLSLITGTWSAPIPACTIYSVSKITAGGTAKILCDGITSERIAVSINAANAPYSYAGAVITGATNLLNLVNVRCDVYNGANSSISINSTGTEATGNAGTMSPTGLIFLKPFVGAQYFIGDLALFAIFGGIHPAALQTRIKRYLGDQYGPVIT